MRIDVSAARSGNQPTAMVANTAKTGRMNRHGDRDARKPISPIRSDAVLSGSPASHPRIRAAAPKR